MTDHSFNPDVAKEVGVIAATLYKNIRHWCEKSRANRKNIHDGKAWTYNSVRAWGELYPYLSDKQIRTALLKLEEAEYIAIGEFNKDNRDRTKWYCDLRVSICPNGKMQLPKKETPTLAHKGEPLPIINPNINHSPLSPPKGKGTRLPENWYPSDEGCQLAASLGVNPNTEIEVFRDYWIAVSGSKGVKLDWDATWRNWVRRSKPSAQNKKSQSEIMIEAFARA